MLSRLSSVKKMGGAERTTNGARLSASPFHNNDDPTPRHAPSSEEEERRLRAEAAAGAGTPGYLTKQQQHVPSSPTTSDDRPGSPLTPAATEGGAGRPSKKTSPHSDGRPISPDPTRLAATGGADSADAGECSTEGASSSSIPSPSADGPGGMPKPSDHQDGIWKGFLSIFSFEKKRASMGHLADGTYADYDEDDEDGGSSLALPPLGPGHDLPRPAALHLDIPSDQDSLLKKSVLEQGRRDSRSVSVLSPRGTAPVAGGTETAEEQRMRAFVQVRRDGRVGCCGRASGPAREALPAPRGGAGAARHSHTSPMPPMHCTALPPRRAISPPCSRVPLCVWTSAPTRLACSSACHAAAPCSPDPPPTSDRPTRPPPPRSWSTARRATSSTGLAKAPRCRIRTREGHRTGRGAGRDAGRTRTRMARSAPARRASPAGPWAAWRLQRVALKQQQLQLRVRRRRRYKSRTCRARPRRSESSGR